MTTPKREEPVAPTPTPTELRAWADDADDHGKRNVPVSPITLRRIADALSSLLSADQEPVFGSVTHWVGKYNELLRRVSASGDASELWVVWGAPEKDGKRYPEHCAGWEDACHEHVNDALANELDEAKDWIVRQHAVSQEAPEPVAQPERQKLGAELASEAGP